MAQTLYERSITIPTGAQVPPRGSTGLGGIGTPGRLTRVMWMLGAAFRNDQRLLQEIEQRKTALEKDLQSKTSILKTTQKPSLKVLPNT